jgi:nucleoside-diphosphate-sugar epimerase
LHTVEVVDVGDIGPDTDWRKAVDGVDAVIHLAARAHKVDEGPQEYESEYDRVNADGTGCLAEAAAAAGVRRFLLLSSIGVLGSRTNGQAFGENDAPKPENAYARSKLKAERLLSEVARATGLDYVVLRAPLVYGPGVPGNFKRLLGLVARRVPLPIASVRNKRSFLYVDNLADAIRCCLEDRHASRGLYHVADATCLSTPDLLRRLARAMGVRGLLLPCSERLLLWCARVAGQQREAEKMVASLVVDDARLREELGWQPRVGVDEALGRTAEWYVQEMKRGAARVAL